MDMKRSETSLQRREWIRKLAITAVAAASALVIAACGGPTKPTPTKHGSVGKTSTTATANTNGPMMGRTLNVQFASPPVIVLDGAHVAGGRSEIHMSPAYDSLLRRA